MILKGKAEAVAQEIIDLFEQGTLPEPLANLYIRLGEERHAAKWSLLNQLLVAKRHYRDARTFNQWKEAGRSVRKGERAFAIWAPITKRLRDPEAAKADTDDGTNAPDADNDGRITVCVGYRTIPVFGYEQTEGEYERLQKILLHRIRKDRFDSKRAGRLLGPLVELPSYLDRATDDQPRMILQYPETEEDPGEILAKARQLPADWVTPKERHVLETLHRHLEAEEKTLLFLRHTGSSHLPRRLRRLIKEHLEAPSIWLDAGKVPTHKRKRWIEEKVLIPEIPILLVNPTAVQTGLNNLTAFNHAIWYELAHTTTYRQANGRIDRLGQKLPVTIHVPYYLSTGQETHFNLVAKKVSASLQVEGLDVRAALEAAGAGGDGEDAAVMAQSLGEAMYEALVQS